MRAKTLHTRCYIRCLQVLIHGSETVLEWWIYELLILAKEVVIFISIVSGVRCHAGDGAITGVITV